jgi:hypothetical protein
VRFGTLGRTRPVPPPHLSTESAEWWKDGAGNYDLAPLSIS